METKFVNFDEAFNSGKVFRHISMRELSTPVWFKKHSESEVHVLGPDDIIPLEEIRGEINPALLEYEYKPAPDGNDGEGV
jgi:hypothetical protein